VVLALAVVALLLRGTAEPAETAAAGKFEIPAWAFDRGNADVYANPDLYADYRDTYPELVAGSYARAARPWFVEYDIDFPGDATYTLHVRYASSERRPIEIWLDDDSAGTYCGRVTGDLPPNPFRRPKLHDDSPAPRRRGAEWEETADIPITHGKHTLKLTRRGAPPNVIALRFESPVGIPKDRKPTGPTTKLPLSWRGERSRHELGWERADPDAKISRVPPIYRNAFLPPGSVNVATLRLAIEDMIASFGSQYPNGPRYLERLDALELAQSVLRDDRAHHPEEATRVEDDLVALRREAMLEHPLLDFDRLLFVKRQTYSSSHIYSDHWDGSGRMGGNLCVLSPVAPDGRVTEIVPEFAGGLFGRFDLSFDSERVVFAYKAAPGEGYRIYEVGIDGSDLRQLTFDDPEESRLRESYGDRFRFEDVDPCYLPDGNILFASTRSKRRVFCFGSTVTSLYLMDESGADPRCISSGPVNELSPSVMHDGRVIYTRWEYVDKGFGNVQSLWAMRPDGSHSTHVYKNDLILPAGMVDARAIPGSQQVVTVAAPHCGLSVGPVVLVDRSVDPRTVSAMTNLTPELGYPGMSHHRSGRTFGYFKEPYPLSEKLFLVAHNPGGAHCSAPKAYGLYLLDAWGNRAELYRDPDISCFQPFPLRPRRKPPAIAPLEYTGEPATPSSTTSHDLEPPKLATLLLQDVYHGLTGVERGRAKYLRVMEAIGISWNEGWRSAQNGDGAGLQASAVSMRCDVNIKKIWGVTKIHADGSAHFAVPAGKNLFFQVLDDDYMELQRMRTFVNLMPGETRSCIGCHEGSEWTPDARSATPLALAGPVQTLQPQPGDIGPRTVHYAVDIRPLLDERCVGCHDGEKPAGDLDLSGELTRLFDRSYENFIEKGLVSYLNDGYGSANVPPELPMTFGSHRSTLVERIRSAPCGKGVTREEFIRIVTWIDANVPYYGTHLGKKNFQWRDEPDFRPLPLTAMKN